MTIYNKKTYRVDDIDWEITPLSDFDMQGRRITFIEYFRERYGINIQNTRQPMLVSRPKKKDFHRGNTGPIMLIPELCRMTGLTDQMRANVNLMRALATHLHTDPQQRVDRLKDFIRRLQGLPEIETELQRWGLRFNNELVKVPGHVCAKEKIIFGDNKHDTADSRYDWGHAFRTKPMLSSIPLKTWAVIVPMREAQVLDKLVRTMQRVAQPLRFPISAPTEL